MYTGTLPAISNRETWAVSVELKDPDTSDAIDLTGATVTLAVRAMQSCSTVLTGSTEDGKITIASPATDGVFSWSFSPSELRSLSAGTYEVGVRVLMASGTYYQLLVAALPVVDGIVDA